MIEFKKGVKRRSKNSLFNPYKNGISSYDMAYLSSKKPKKDKAVAVKIKIYEDHLAA